MKKLLLIAPLALVAMAGTAHIYNSAETNSFTHKTVEVSKAETVEDEAFLVYFHLPEGWNTPNIWPWETDSGTNPYTPIGWPGLAMIEDSNNEGWYYRYVPSYVDQLIFSYTDDNGTIVQTNGRIVAMLLDLNMPNVNGFQVLEYFKANNLFDKIPVSIITGLGNEDFIKKAREYPIVDILRKPFNERDIKTVVEKTVKIN